VTHSNNSAAITEQVPSEPLQQSRHPRLLVEVMVSNEPIPVLTQIDLGRYFAIGTGTQAWLGVNICCDGRNNHPSHRWWYGWATRDQGPNGVFLILQPFAPNQCLS
jgi:hypothetical protein